MKLNGLHVFLLLLTGVVLCSVLNDKTVREGMASGRVANRRFDPDKMRELQNYKRESMRENKRLHERLHRLENKENQHKKETKMAIKKAVEKYEREQSTDEDEYKMYDDHNKLYDRLSKENYDDTVHFDVDDHSVKRRTRNKAKMESLSNKIPNKDKYILKTQVVPPADVSHGGHGFGPGVGPGVGPGTTHGGDVQPCPPCGRCPEPAFTCKKVPNYGSGNAGAALGSSGGLPKPILSDFSTFGA